MTDRRRLLRVTAGNLRQSHLYVAGHLDFFPESAFGKSKRTVNGNGHSGIEIFLDGLDETVVTDIGSDAKTGKPRGFLRGRSWVKRFYDHHGVDAGALLALDRIADSRFRLSVVKKLTNPKAGFRAAEFFAGIGLVRLAFEQKGWRVIFANDIDAAKAEM